MSIVSPDVILGVTSPLRSNPSMSAMAMNVNVPAAAAVPAMAPRETERSPSVSDSSTCPNRFGNTAGRLAKSAKSRALAPRLSSWFCGVYLCLQRRETPRPPSWSRDQNRSKKKRRESPGAEVIGKI